jgi:hypothetical protein
MLRSETPSRRIGIDHLIMFLAGLNLPLAVTSGDPAVGWLSVALVGCLIAKYWRTEEARPTNA